MLKIGITGGIGSGKTLVCNIFSCLSVPIYNADFQAKKIINTNLEIKEKLINNFGKNIYLKSGKIDKIKLSKIIFNDKEAIQLINKIIHPVVRTDYHKWINKHKAQKYTIKEAAILFESGAYKELDKIITVYSPQNIKIKRIIKRDKINQTEILKKMKNQMSDKLKIKKADYVIFNNEKQLLLAQIIKLHKIFNSI